MQRETRGARKSSKWRKRRTTSHPKKRERKSSPWNWNRTQQVLRDFCIDEENKKEEEGLKLANENEKKRDDGKTLASRTKSKMRKDQVFLWRASRTKGKKRKEKEQFHFFDINEVDRRLCKEKRKKENLAFVFSLFFRKISIRCFLFSLFWSTSHVKKSLCFCENFSFRVLRRN